ncbi:nitrite reductase/ring-hydroxylating ferredoxin subunit [Kibdelosporangium banguiense]|uniref:Nitrite reductase/ring-hydroxylating ferredoxin subunit n=1 Tax=Kibdelosporangium banguiense TaxID=1365924 RepID=A0ABS4T7P4_9PSEU|nr:bifunctional 3-phenylpropionate/cinnamic acid dioxygenase ferredoxin subunit [Kibdelosporangium banguiense]MBP2320422.1 nitrite reductase/ring-hydroxylating ferredoxin subunit [Kibdelosporangium banguiense]
MTIDDIEGRTWRRACALDAVPEDEGLRLGTLPPVAVFVQDEEVFCLDDTCTHDTYSLAEGWVEDGAVECTLHLAKFDLRTGMPLRPPASVPVAVHPVKVVDGDVYVALPNAYLTKE